MHASDVVTNGSCSYRDRIRASPGGGDAVLEGDAFPEWHKNEVHQLDFMPAEHHRGGGVTRRLHRFVPQLDRQVGNGCCTNPTVVHGLNPQFV